VSLALSGVGVGLLSQPFYTAHGLYTRALHTLHRSRAAKTKPLNNPGCKEYTMFTVIISVFCIALFFGVVASSSDRFLAIHLHLRHHELVTHGRVVAAVISMWLLNVFLPLMIFWAGSFQCLLSCGVSPRSCFGRLYTNG